MNPWSNASPRTRINIGDRSVGGGSPPFIVAEAGINHNGELRLALEMVKLAKDAGADAIKFQTFKAEEFVADRVQTYTYRSQGRDVTESMWDMFKRVEFSPREWRTIAEECGRVGIPFLSTPQNPSDLEILLDIGIPAVKVGSDDFTNIPLLRRYAATGLPLIISSGMADMGDVHAALEAVGALDGYPTILLACTSEYPTPPADANVRRLVTLRAAFPGIELGFSDHTQGPLACSLAVALGAVLVEKHFTLSHDLPGPDHWFAEDPDGLRALVNAVRTSHTLLGSGLVRPTAAEMEMRVLARRSVVAVTDIARGERFTERNTGLRRPGNGLPPAMLDQVQSFRARADLKAGALIRVTDLD